MCNHDIYFMNEALLEAQKSLENGEVPIGAIIVHNGMIIGRGFNSKEAEQIATHHAEVQAIEMACKSLQSWRLHECTLYVTLEPCVMCSGAIIQSHLGRVIIGTAAQKQKGLLSLIESFPKPSFNHYPEIAVGICEIECKSLIQTFFKDVRSKRK